MHSLSATPRLSTPSPAWQNGPRGLGYVALQLPTNVPHIFDLAKAAESTGYCQEIQGLLGQHGLAVSELSTHLQGQLIAVHPAYDALFDVFAPASVHGNERARREWATGQMKMAATASKNLGLTARTRPSAARSRGPSFTHGRSGPPASSKRHSPN